MLKHGGIEHNTTNMLMSYHSKMALCGLYNRLDHHLIFSWQSDVLLPLLFNYWFS